MKVIYNWEGFMPSRGGVARLFYELAKYGFAQKDVDFHLCSGLYRSLYLKGDAELKRNSCGIFVPPPLDKYRLLMPLNCLIFPLYSKYHGADLCHYTNLNVPYVPKKTKTVITVHDLIDEIFNPFGMQSPRAIERRRALDRTDGVICVSEHTKQDLLKFYPDVSPDKVRVIYNGNDIQKITPEPYLGRKPYLLYVGARHSDYKNFTIILRTLSRYKKLEELDLICYGGGKFTAKESNLILSLGLNGRIYQTSGSDEKLAGYYASAFAFVYPSRYEGFGIPTLEAMSLGCPLVCSSAPPMPEVNGDGALYFNPDSEDELSENLVKLKDSVIRKQYVEKGRLHASQFSWNKCCEQTFAFYAELVDSIKL